ncbi:uncharacterized protein LOC124829830 [Vigna umbellata]|uniref:uncharacterized protein LOC124829830 n=1 Tax=Vigna umbellata TaxID=87088 RepID=UPI001F5F6531|nr:uncharacterized protein LOC124829830 [Vigna umbellata]
MPLRLHPKLSARYYGPFEVLPQVGKVAFHLQLPEAARIHPIFHLSQLKKAVGEKRVEKALPAELQANEPLFWPVRILDRRTRQLASEKIPQVLIEWQEGGQEGATWKTWQPYRSSIMNSTLGSRLLEGRGVMLGVFLFVACFV